MSMPKSGKNSFTEYLVTFLLLLVLVMYINRWGVFAPASYAGIEDDPNIVVVMDDNFADLAGPDSGLVLLDFWAPWCGPCRVFGPTIAEIAAEKKGEITVGTVNVDKNGALGKKYDITGIPTVVLLQNGKTVWRDTGVVPKRYILDEIQAFIPEPSTEVD